MYHIIICLIDVGANVNLQDKSGFTLLILAFRLFVSVELLLQEGADRYSSEMLG